MVSPLSSRILNAEAKANINGSSTYAHMPLTANVIEDWQRRANAKKRVSGYSADRSDHGSLLTGVSSLDSKAIRANQIEQHAKRRRTEEASFQAFNARNDLAKAEVQCLHGLIGTSRALPHGSVNMDRVKLVVVSRDKPYNYESDLEGDIQGDVEVVEKNNNVSLYEDYIQLLCCSQHFYTIEGRIPTPSEEATSDRSNLESVSNTTMTTNTPTECSSDSEGDLIVIPPKPQNENDNQYKENVRASEDLTHYISSSAGLTTVTLEDALVPSETETARLILEGTASFSIVHTNAAFSRLTGIPSDEIIGTSLKDALDISFLMHKGSQSTMVSLCAKRGVSDCSTVVSLKTSAVKSNGKVTHFVLDFHMPSSDQMSHEDNATLVHNQPLQAIG